MKKVVVLGAGESGVGAALLAKSKNLEVFVSDFGQISEKYKNVLIANEIEFEEGKHTQTKILDADVCVKSPGIPEKVSIVQEIIKSNIAVISEIEFAYQYTNAKFIAITGSNGKTTTTLLTYHLLESAGLSVGLAGNIGDSLAKQVIEDQYDYYVLELSSFQLDNMYQFKADIAVLLNITPDHLDRYEYKFENYIASKYRILQNLSERDYFIYYLEDVTLSKTLLNESLTQVPSHLPVSLQQEVSEGAYVKDEHLNFTINNQKYTLPLSVIQLKGVHNLINSLVAISTAITLDISIEKITEGLKTFVNAPHRLEKVTSIQEVIYVNDSKATNVDAVKYALDSFDEPIVWIAGGVDKGNDYTEIENLVKEKVKALVCLGTDNTALTSFFTGKIDQIVETNSMESAVNIATELAKKGDYVLLSPACASFDLFKSYIDRGDQFKEVVKSL